MKKNKSEGFGNKDFLYSCANPTAFQAPLTNQGASAGDHVVLRFKPWVFVVTSDTVGIG
jgi:hypothetical protein